MRSLTTDNWLPVAHVDVLLGWISRRLAWPGAEAVHEEEFMNLAAGDQSRTSEPRAYTHM